MKKNMKKKYIQLSDGIPVELFQILKDDAVKMLHSICQQIWHTQPRAGKDLFAFQSQRKAMPKNIGNHGTPAETGEARGDQR